MNVIEIINKYYPQGRQRDILVIHSKSVAHKALQISANHPELQLDDLFIEEAAMLHDIGIFLTHAPGINCFGAEPYLSHGYLGADLMRSEGYPKHALVCERHTGAGIALVDIESKFLKLPKRDLLPVSLEEQVICFADKFFSKTHLYTEKSLDDARRSVAKYGDESVKRFNSWCEIFL